MSSLGHSAFHAGISGLRARSALTSAYQQGDVKRVKRFFKTVDIGGKVGGLFMALILVALSISMFMTAFSSQTDGSRTAPSIPAEAGALPVTAVYDDTGFVADYHIEHLPDSFEHIADDYHIQTAVYSSSAPAHDVYDSIFTDENGVVLYIEEHEDYGTLTYYWGDNLDSIFTAENIEILDSAQTYLDARTHDRASNVVSDFRTGLNQLFNGPEHKSLSAPFEFATAIFWLLMAPVFYLLVNFLICGLTGVPFSKKKRKALLDRMVSHMEQNPAPT
jgi:hypothetical protein